MLQAIRSKAGSLVVKLLFGVLIVTFGIWGIGDIFRNHSQDTTVATVGGRTIDAQKFRDSVQRALERLRAETGQNIDLQQAKRLGVIGAVLGQLIDQNLLDQEVGRLRLDVSDDVIRSAIYSDPSFRTAKGGFDRARFDEMLAANRMSEDQFVAELRDTLPRSQLIHAVTVGTNPPPALADALYRYQNEKRVADIVALPLAKAPDPGQPDAAALSKFYGAHHDLFEAPEYRAFTVASLAPADVAAAIKVPDVKLQQAYKEQEDELRVPERRDVQQIIAPSEAKAKAAEAALAAGRHWQDVATTIAGERPDAIDLGLVSRQDLPPGLAQIAFGLKLNTPSKPVNSTLGWHILRVVKIVPGTTETFAQAKPKLNESLARNEALDRIYATGNHVDDAIAGGASLSEAAKKYGLKVTQVAAADETGKDPAGKPVALPYAAGEALKLAFETEKGRTSRVIHPNDGGIFVVRVDNIVPPRLRPLSEVKDKAIAAWQAAQRRDEIAKEAAALKATVAPGTPLKAAAAAKGFAATTSAPLGRGPQPDQSVPAALIGQIFAAQPGSVVTSSDAAGSYVAQLDKIETPQTAAPDVAKNVSLELDQAMRTDLIAEFTDALRRRFPVAVNRDTVERLF